MLSRRIISWLSQAALVLEDADARFYRRFVRSLVRQVRYLRHTARDARRGVASMQAVIALAYAALCIAGQSRHIKSATERLRVELERQILPDGGHVGRDPGAIIEVLLELLPLSQVFATRNIAPPQALLNAIDRMMPMLRFFRHSDGTFAHFNGMGATPHDQVMTLLAYDETHGAPLSSAPYSAYQRLEAGGGVLIMDVGGAPPIEMSLEAHAGCLSFEFSSPKQNLIVVNCGMPPTGREEWRQFARSTAAHSTVAFNDASSARFVETEAFKRVLGGSPMLGGPSNVAMTREDRTDGIVLRAAHDGYADRYGIVHERTIVLARDGTEARRRGHVRRLRRRRADPHHAGQLHGAVSSAPDGQGDAADRRPRRHADDAEQGSLDVHRAAKPGGARRQRLSRRQRRRAPHRADRHPRQGPRRAAGAVDVPADRGFERGGGHQAAHPRDRAKTSAVRLPL